MRYLVRAMPLGLLLAVLAAQPVNGDSPVKLEVGDAAPAFAATDDQGRVWQSSAHVGKKYLVLYFYPGDFTPGCIRQAQSFQDSMNKLNDQGAQVVGISGDSVATHALFKKSQKLNFTLLADEDGSLAKRFGVPVGPGGEVRTKDADGKPLTLKRAVTAARWTFVIDTSGKIVYKNTKVNPVLDSKQVAAIIDHLTKN